MNTIISPEGLEEIRKAATARGWVQRGGADWLDPADDGQPWPAPGIRICWHANGKEVSVFGEKTVTYPVALPVSWLLTVIDEAYPLATEPPDLRATCTAASRLDEPVIVATPDFGAKILTVTLPDGWRLDDATIERLTAPFRHERDAAMTSIREATHTLAVALDHDTEAALVLETAAVEVVRRWRRDNETWSDAVASLRHERDTARADLEVARAAWESDERFWGRVRHDARSALTHVIAALDTAGIPTGLPIAERMDLLRAKAGEAAAKTTAPLWEAIDLRVFGDRDRDSIACHEVVDAAVTELRTLRGDAAALRSRLSHVSTALTVATADVDPLLAELRAIDEALGYGEGSTRSEGDRVARVKDLADARRELRAASVMLDGMGAPPAVESGLAARVRSIRAAILADIDAALEGHIRPDGDRAQSIRDLVAGRQRPESPYLSRMEGALMAKDPDLLERVRRG